MKQDIFYTAMVAMSLLCSWGFTSCADDEGATGVTISTPAAYIVDAAKYEISDNAMFQTIELTESGDFIILGAGVATSGSRAVLTTQEPVCGSYTKSGQGRFALDGYGEMQVASNGADGYIITMMPSSGPAVTLSAVKSEPLVTPTAKTQKLCRQWQFAGLRSQLVDAGGQTLYDKWCGSMMDMHRWIYEWCRDHDPDFDEREWCRDVNGRKVYEWETQTEVVRRVIFTQSGTYLVQTNCGTQVSYWRWKDEARGEISTGGWRTSDGRIKFAERDDVHVNVVFEDGRMALTNTFTDVLDADGDGKTDNCIYAGTTQTDYLYFSAAR